MADTDTKTDASGACEKAWWESKELLVAGVSLAAGALQSNFGWVVTPEQQLNATVLLMAFLRLFFTRHKLTLSAPATPKQPGS